LLQSVKSAHQRVGRQPRDDVPQGGNRGRKITGHAGREPAKVDTRMTVSRIDILVQHHGSIALLRPSTAAGREWLDANCNRTDTSRLRAGRCCASRASWRTSWPVR
jgi:hypothetical protein